MPIKGLSRKGVLELQWFGYIVFGPVSKDSDQLLPGNDSVAGEWKSNMAAKHGDEPWGRRGRS